MFSKQEVVKAIRKARRGNDKIEVLTQYSNGDVMVSVTAKRQMPKIATVRLERLDNGIVRLAQTQLSAF